MSIKISVRDAELIRELKAFTNELRTTITNSLDPVLDSLVDDLKATLRTILNNQITIGATLPDPTKKLPPALNIAKSKADLIKEIFEEDITTSDYFQRSLGNKTVNDKSRVFVYDGKKIKAWQSVTDSSTYAGQESNFRNRLMGGILINAKDGSIMKIHPDDVKGLKLECSKDSGQTINSEKKFEAYKNSPDITRRKYDAPYSRTAVWTVRQEDAQKMLEGALPLNQILDQILQGDYTSAVELFTRNNKGGIFTKALENIENLKNNQSVSPDIQTRIRITTLINNLKIKKSISNVKTKYILYSNYDPTVEESSDKFFELLRREIFLWKVSNEQKLVNTIIKAINKVIAKYSKSGLIK